MHKTTEDNLSFKFEKTEIEDLMIIYPFLANDGRGFYKKYFEKRAFQEMGLPTEFYEASDILSNRGAIRGLHYQDTYSQGKLLHVITGELYDVVLDLRPQSKTFGKWKSFVLSAKDSKMIYVPEGFAHGCMALEDNTILSYMCTNKYVPESCGGIIWNDESLNIPWPIVDEKELIITDKDKTWPSFIEYCDQRGISI